MELNQEELSALSNFLNASPVLSVEVLAIAEKLKAFLSPAPSEEVAAPVEETPAPSEEVVTE